MIDKNKKAAYAVIVMAIVALLIVTVWQPGEWSFRDRTDYDEQARLADEELQAYREFLAELKPNYEASQQMLQKIATEEVVRKEVEETLQTKQAISIPQLASTELNISSRTDRDFMQNYLIKTKSMFDNFVETAKPADQDLFSNSSSSLQILRAEQAVTELVNNLKSIEVPQNAAEMHKSSIVAYQEYGNLFSKARAYAPGSDENPWPTVYNKYAVIDNQLAKVNTDLENINRTYAFGPDVELPEFSLVKTAQAQWAVTVVTDWQQIVFEGIKSGLASAFAQFSVVMIDKLVSHIEKSFAIASQLYYSNELGRFYSIEYMKKFVENPIDQDIIQKFLPEYFCVNPDAKKLEQIFTAKARTNVGSDIVINPSDPDFLQKLARLGGDEKNYPLWWEGYYESLAAQTKAEAQAAATKEVISPGIKTGRDLIKGQVNKTVSAIFNVQESAISGAMNLGTNNTENVVGQLVSGVVQNLVNKFIFTPISGGSSTSGGIGVIAEKDVCLDVQQVKPIIPLPDSTYNAPTGTDSPIPEYTPPTGTPPFDPRA